ncbi:hypothetical protein CG706_27035, partial [Escherichia coli]
IMGGCVWVINCLRKLLRDVKIVKLITRGWVGHIKNGCFPSLLIYSIIIFNKIDKLLLMD